VNYVFSWQPFFREMAARLLEFQTRQDELLQILQEIKAQSLPLFALDDSRRGVDPFTVFASFNRGVREGSRVQIAAVWKEKLQIAAPVPHDWSGVPLAENNASWFFDVATRCGPDDVENLWRLARQVINSGPQNLDAGLFETCCRIRCIRHARRGVPPKLTIGLFWLNSDEYLPLDDATTAYLQRHDLPESAATLRAYIELIEAAKARFNQSLPQIVFEAAQRRNPRYWAGGHEWNGKSQLKRFRTHHEWQLQLDGENKASAKRYRALFGQIQPGDEFAIKGCGGAHLRVHYIGWVREVLPESGTIKLEPQPDRPLYRGARPSGPGAGAWPDALLEVKRAADIATLFYGAPNSSLVPVDSGLSTSVDGGLSTAPLNLILYGPPGTGKTYASIERAVEIIEGRNFSSHSEAKARFDILRREGRIGFVTFHQSFAYEDFIEGIRPMLKEGAARYQCHEGIFKQIAKRALKDASRRYVLIVDEINRGNVAKIFGELITLLEEDKRLGAPNELRVALPYSGEEFALPPNLYVIGTMNSSDKSLALLDVALRRRFDFEELRPDFSPQTCQQLSASERKILEELNRRLMVRRDREHRIGHAYFLAGDDFNTVFRRKVIPLLQEYFSNDSEGLRFVLGESGAGRFLPAVPISPDEEGWARTVWQWYFDAGQTLDERESLRLNYGFEAAP
jgi:DNA polymerase III delta prime subunit